MAFHDILHALTVATDGKIAKARHDAQSSLEEARASLAAAADDKIAFIASERDRKKKNMERQVTAHALMTGRQALMKAKHELVERVYDQVLTSLVSLDAAKTESFLRTLIDSCPSDGTLRPTQQHAAIVKKLAGGRTIGEPVKGRGGFVCESAKSDRDCRYESLVNDILRPATELAVAESLFPSKA